MISCGKNHTLLLAHNEFFARGENKLGECGIQPEEKIPFLMHWHLITLSSSLIIKIAAGYHYSLALDKEGILWGCGSNLNHQLGLRNPDPLKKWKKLKIHALMEGEYIIDVFTGASHSFVLTSRYRILAAGANQDKQCGKPTLEHLYEWQVVELPVEDGDYIVRIAAGAKHSLALSAQGRLLGCGYGHGGQFGAGLEFIHVFENWVHIPVNALSPGEMITNIYAGLDYSMLLTSDNRLLVAGKNHMGQCGLGEEVVFTENWQSINLPLMHDEKIVDLATHSSHSFVWTSRQRVFTCGNNQRKQCGINQENLFIFDWQLVPLALLANEKITKIYCGGWHSFIETSIGRLLACGDNQYRQCMTNLPIQPIMAFTLVFYLKKNSSPGHFFRSSINIISQSAIFKEKKHINTVYENFKNYNTISSERTCNLIDRLSYNIPSLPKNPVSICELEFWAEYHKIVWEITFMWCTMSIKALIMSEKKLNMIVADLPILIKDIYLLLIHHTLLNSITALMYIQHICWKKISWFNSHISTRWFGIIEPNLFRFLHLKNIENEIVTNKKTLRLSVFPPIVLTPKRTSAQKLDIPLAPMRNGTTQADFDLFAIQTTPHPSDEYHDAANLLDQLPNEVVMYIFKFLNIEDIINFSQTSIRFYELAKLFRLSHVRPDFTGYTIDSGLANQIGRNTPKTIINLESFSNILNRLANYISRSDLLTLKNLIYDLLIGQVSVVYFYELLVHTRRLYQERQAKKVPLRYAIIEFI